MDVVHCMWVIEDMEGVTEWRVWHRRQGSRANDDVNVDVV